MPLRPTAHQLPHALESASQQERAGCPLVDGNGELVSKILLIFPSIADGLRYNETPQGWVLAGTRELGGSLLSPVGLLSSQAVTLEQELRPHIVTDLHPSMEFDADDPR